MNDNSLSSKAEKSIPFFKNSRVDTCSHIIMKNGQAVAVPYMTSSPWNSRSLYCNDLKSTEKRSLSHDVHRVRQNLHAGMHSKPLERYSPDAQRSRLKNDEFIIPYKNTSQIVIGDRSSKYKRHFLTTAQNLLKRPSIELSTNLGILSEKTKWIKYKEDS
ncbi:unnamed protein product [Blepharisma stoltei]|uniref:Uncharacterized protein n=1 Tax=Blepharisma stoltei TaxID=1481888 RepID=A0AAU9J0Q9_9CILI|nr:unnamed protein product [Blepharisma stoltei]